MQAWHRSFRTFRTLWIHHHSHARTPQRPLRHCLAPHPLIVLRTPRYTTPQGGFDFHQKRGLASGDGLACLLPQPEGDWQGCLSFMPHTTGRLVSAGLARLIDQLATWLPIALRAQLFMTCQVEGRSAVLRPSRSADSRTARSMGQDLASRRAQPYLPSARPTALADAVHSVCAEGERGLGYAVGTVNCSLYIILGAGDVVSLKDSWENCNLGLCGRSAALVGGQGGEPSGDCPGPPWPALACPGLPWPDRWHNVASWCRYPAGCFTAICTCRICA